MQAVRSNRLLLVEDDVEMTELVTEALVDDGYVVDQAHYRRHKLGREVVRTVHGLGYRLGTL